MDGIVGWAKPYTAVFIARFDRTTAIFLGQLDTNYKIEGNASKMVDLAQAYHFLQYIGDYRPKKT